MTLYCPGPMHWNSVLRLWLSSIWLPYFLIYSSDVLSCQCSFCPMHLPIWIDIISDSSRPVAFFSFNFFLTWSRCLYLAQSRRIIWIQIFDQSFWWDREWLCTFWGIVVSFWCTWGSCVYRRLMSFVENHIIL